MPIDHEVEAGILKVRMHGAVTTSEFAGYLAATADQRELSRLLILSDDVSFPSSPEIIAYAGKTPMRQLSPNVRFACVARSPLAIGITSMFMGNAGLGSNYQLFDDESQARAWLAGS
jgi:hypothetical protein